MSTLLYILGDKMSSTLCTKLDESQPRKAAVRERYATLGQQIRALRQEKDLTQIELSQQSGVCRGEISNLERDKVKNPRNLTLERIFSVTGHPDQQKMEEGTIIPPNIDKFAQERGLKYQEVRRLVSLHLKPVAKMTEKELEYLFQLMKEFPDLFEATNGGKPYSNT